MYPSEFNRIDSTRCTTQNFIGISVQIKIPLALIPLRICVVQRVESIRLKSEGYNCYILIFERIFERLIWRVGITSQPTYFLVLENIDLFGRENTSQKFFRYSFKWVPKKFFAWKHKPKIFLGTHLNEYLKIFFALTSFFHFWSKIVKNYPV